MAFQVLAIDANVIPALIFLPLLAAGVIAFAVYKVLTRLPKDAVDKLLDHKCPLTGRYLSVKTVKDEEKTTEKYNGSSYELVFKKHEDGTFRGGLVGTPHYRTHKYEGIIVERLENVELGYTVLRTQKTNTEYRKHRDPERFLEKEEHLLDNYVWEVENFGKLSKIDRIRLKKVCKKAGFRTDFEQ